MNFKNIVSSVLVFHLIVVCGVPQIISGQESESLLGEGQTQNETASARPQSGEEKGDEESNESTKLPIDDECNDEVEKEKQQASADEVECSDVIDDIALEGEEDIECDIDEKSFSKELNEELEADHEKLESDKDSKVKEALDLYNRHFILINGNDFKGLDEEIAVQELLKQKLMSMNGEELAEIICELKDATSLGLGDRLKKYGNYVMVGGACIGCTPSIVTMPLGMALGLSALIVIPITCSGGECPKGYMDLKEEDWYQLCYNKEHGEYDYTLRGNACPHGFERVDMGSKSCLRESTGAVTKRISKLHHGWNECRIDMVVFGSIFGGLSIPLAAGMGVIVVGGLMNLSGKAINGISQLYSYIAGRDQSTPKYQLLNEEISRVFPSSYILP